MRYTMYRRRSIRAVSLAISLLFVTLVALGCAAGTASRSAIGNSETAGVERSWAIDFFGTSPVELHEHLSWGSLSVPLPWKWRAGSSESGSEVKIFDTDDNLALTVRRIPPRQGVDVHIAAEYFVRSMEGFERVESVPVFVDGFAGLVMRLAKGDFETTLLAVEAPEGHFVLSCPKKNEPILPWISITPAPHSVRHRRNYQFYSFGSNWRWTADYRDGFIVRGSVGEAPVTLTVYSAEGSSAAGEADYETELFINNRKRPASVRFLEEDGGKRRYIYTISSPSGVTVLEVTGEGASDVIRTGETAFHDEFRLLLESCLSIESSRYIDLSGGRIHLWIRPE